MTSELAKQTVGALSASALAIAIGFLITPKPAAASVVNVIGGPGLDQGALCVTGQLCPGTSPAFPLNPGTAAAVSGSFDYNSVTHTVDFSLTLLANASFGSETLLQGSVFSANGVPVGLSSLGGGATQVTQNGAATGLANLSFAPGLSMILGVPVISGLTCSFGTGSDQCGVSLGAGGLEVGPDFKNVDYNAFQTFNVAVAPVPLPAAAWLMFSGLGYFAVLRRARRLTT